MNKFLVKRLRYTVLIEEDIFFIQSRKHLLRKDTVIFALLSVYLLRNLLQSLFRLSITFIGILLFHDYTPVFCYPYFVEFFQVRGIDGQKLYSFIHRKSFIFRLQ